MMANEKLLLDKLSRIADELGEHYLLRKSIFNFRQACKYLDLSPSRLNALLKKKQVPHFYSTSQIPYFLREELDNWLINNREIGVGKKRWRTKIFNINNLKTLMTIYFCWHQVAKENSDLINTLWEFICKILIYLRN